MAPLHTVLSIPHQVALSGIVIDAETSRRLAGVTVTITTMPAIFQAFLSGKALQHGDRWATLSARPDLTSTAPDGSFCFVDLPDGAYQLTFSAPRDIGVYGRSDVAFAVARDAKGKISPRMQVVRMPPTGVRGVVNGTTQAGGGRDVVAPVPAVCVRVRGSGELTYSSTDGRFYLPDLDPGTLTLEISAPNHEPATRMAMIVRGAISDLGVVTLASSPVY